MFVNMINSHTINSNNNHDNNNSLKLQTEQCHQDQDKQHHHHLGDNNILEKQSPLTVDLINPMTNELQTISDVPDFKYRIGYWWSDKKSQRLNAAELGSLFAERGCLLVKIDLEKNFEDQGPFALIFHKISDVMVRANQGDLIAKKTITLFESYIRKHPEIIILDPLDNVRVLLDRYEQYRLIEQSGLAKECNVFTPPFVHLTSTNIDVNRGRIRRSKITFPLVCKPILAQGSNEAHQMCIIFNEAGLKDVKPPCVAQSFVNHNARLFKLFVIKDNYYIIERPSLKNFQACETKETVFFFSHDISKPNSSSSLTELDEEDRVKLEELMSKMKNMNFNDEKGEYTNGDLPSPNQMDKEAQESSIENNEKEEVEEIEINNTTYSPIVPNNERLNKIVKIFSEKLGLSFYGLDIIIENGTSRYAIIDMNPFPGYDGVENFLCIFRDVVCDAIPKNENSSGEQQNPKVFQIKINSKRKQTEIDSGIEST